MGSRRFVDIWEVFDVGGGCLGFVNDGGIRDWSTAIERLSLELRKNMWQLRARDREILCPFGTQDALCYKFVLSGTGEEEEASALLGYTVAIRAIEL